MARLLFSEDILLTANMVNFVAIEEENNLLIYFSKLGTISKTRNCILIFFVTPFKVVGSDVESSWHRYQRTKAYS